MQPFSAYAQTQDGEQVLKISLSVCLECQNTVDVSSTRQNINLQ
jgi:hypothetical protein